MAILMELGAWEATQGLLRDLPAETTPSLQDLPRSVSLLAMLVMVWGAGWGVKTIGVTLPRVRCVTLGGSLHLIDPLHFLISTMGVCFPASGSL